ncbi:MAG: 23S rRNA (uridine(2552)-2'-O)-methyltransferase RlmE [Gammaproteobacteria bacterium]|nr:23S rRNA (uridine(2552)-2'-O)-methyltransferase RlmE [Gammaproteobacteria bacterium]
MARSKSSSRWLREHFSDPYVKKSQQEGYRSRAVYKLEEIQKKSRIIRPGMNVVDLGSSPGGWSQYAAPLVGKSGNVFALDILPMDPIPDVHFIEGDFREDEALEKMMSVLDNQRIDLVMSDMAPNISGMEAVDQPRAMYLVELAADMAEKTLKSGGTLLVKAFHGEGFDEVFREIRQHYDKVSARKPQASRSRSREVYLLAQGFRM